MRERHGHGGLGEVAGVRVGQGRNKRKGVTVVTGLRAACLQVALVLFLPSRMRILAQLASLQCGGGAPSDEATGSGQLSPCGEASHEYLRSPRP